MGSDLKSSLRPAPAFAILFAVLLGILYPLALTGIGHLVFPVQADGSLQLDANGRVIGSSLIGQSFVAPDYFHGRPSAAGKGYDPTASSGSNLGPTSKELSDRVKTDVAALEGAPKTVPVDLITASGSGLDPDISPAAAFFQVPRVSAARRADPARIRTLVDGAIDRPALDFLGEPRVNVLALNRALDRSFPRP